jgi:hypothetical protein
MPQATDLMGVGIPPLAADELGNTANIVTCAGTGQTTATSIKTKNSELVAASSQTGAILPSSAKIGSPYYVVASASTAAVVYVPVGQYLNGAQNDSLTLTQNKAAILWQYKLNNWTKVLTA